MERLFQQKMAQAVDYLKEYKIDLWLIFASEGSDPAVKLLTGLDTVGKTFFLITSIGQKIALCSQIDALESQNSGLFDRVETYSNDPAAELKKLLNSLEPATIAINYSEDDALCDGLTTGRYRWLSQAVGEELSSKFTSAAPFLQRLRAVKAKEEIRRIEKAIDITLDIYDEVFSQVKAGMSEIEIGQLFMAGMEKRGVVEGISKTMAPPMILKDRISHRKPSDEKTKPGDFLIIDFSVDYLGYTSDIARTAYFLAAGETEAPAALQETFEAVHTAISLAFAAVKPGVRGIDVDTAARDYYRDRGLPDITHSVGHQIGRAVHDGGTIFAPDWDRYGQAMYGIVEENMVFTLEPTILRPDGEFSVLSEENILVTADGARFLSRRQESIVLIGP